MIATDMIVVSSISALVQLFLVVMYDIIYWIFSNFAYVVPYVTTRSYPPSCLLNQSFEADIPPTLVKVASDGEFMFHFTVTDAQRGVFSIEIYFIHPQRGHTQHTLSTCSFIKVSERVSCPPQVLRAFQYLAQRHLCSAPLDNE